MSRGPNPSGVVVFTADDVEYSLLFTIDAICRLENKLDLGIDEIVERIQTRPRMGLLRAVLHAGLREQHPSLTEAEAGELFRSYGSEALGEKLSDAFKAAFGVKDEVDGASADPQPAAPAT